MGQFIKLCSGQGDTGVASLRFSSCQIVQSSFNLLPGEELLAPPSVNWCLPCGYTPNSSSRTTACWITDQWLGRLASLHTRPLINVIDGGENRLNHSNMGLVYRLKITWKGLGCIVKVYKIQGLYFNDLKGRWPNRLFMVNRPYCVIDLHITATLWFVLCYGENCSACWLYAPFILNYAAGFLAILVCTASL